MINLQVLQAGPGDCMILTYTYSGKTYQVWIDCGMRNDCKKILASRIPSNPEEQGKISLLVITHRDSDHIANAEKLFSSKQLNASVLNEVWFHLHDPLFSIPALTKKVSYNQGKRFDRFARDQELKCPEEILAPREFYRDGGYFRILGPDRDALDALYTLNKKEAEKSKKASASLGNIGTIEALSEKEFEEDDKITNRSSIAFLWELRGHRILFAGDSVPSILIKSLNDLGYTEEKPLKLDYFKIPHHASAHNLSNELIRCIDCQNYIISTEEVENRPNKEALARIIKNARGPVTFYHNYKIKWKNYFETWEFQKYHMKFRLIQKTGITVEETE